MSARNANAYLEASLAGLSPAELVVKLMEKQPSNLEAVAVMTDPKDYRALYPKIIQTFEVLDDSLADDGDLANQLSQLYQYMRARFMSTRVEKIHDVAVEAINLLTPIKNAYVQILTTKS